MALTIVAQIIAKPGHEGTVQAALEALIPPTRQEDGCLQYDLHADLSTQGTFLFFENWENRNVWQKHMAAPHLAAYLEATDGLVASFTVQEMRKID